ncbi:MAG: hypothetical protein ACLTDC_10705 [Lachnospiraceae bacterium]
MKVQMRKPFKGSQSAKQLVFEVNVYDEKGPQSAQGDALNDAIINNEAFMAETGIINDRFDTGNTGRSGVPAFLTCTICVLRGL